MTKLASLALIAICIPAVAVAEDQWSVETRTFTRSDQSSIRVTQPDGYQVSIVVNGRTSAETVPTILAVPTADGYYSVTFTAPNGAKWTHKVEVRKFQTTDLRVKHVVVEKTAPAQPAAPAVRSFIGSIHNKVATCGKKLAARVELLDASGAVTASIVIKSGSFEQATIASGTYDFRAYVADGSQWTYQTTGRAVVDQDNWQATLICGAGPLEVRFGR